jgi:1-acyl-sn-glycerol-3-phosphate acyltransferase
VSSASPVAEIDEIWQPRSGCGAHCIADDEPGPTVGLPLQAGRMVALVAVMLAASAILPVLPLLRADRRSRVVRRFAHGVLRALGIRLEFRGVGPERGGIPGGPAFAGSLIVMNHVSWLDIVVLLAAGRSRIVAKTEVRGWPVIGQIARYTGTIFVNRSRPLTLPATVAEARDALAAGQTVSVFPEGTTSCGRTVRRFRPAFFQAAADTAAPIVPVTLRFAESGAGRTSAAAFIGDDTLLDSIRRIVGLRGLTISACYGTTIYPAPGATRRTLARMAATAVGASPPAIHAGRRLTITVPAPRTAPAPRTVPAPAPAPAAEPTAPVALRSAA